MNRAQEIQRDVTAALGRPSRRYLLLLALAALLATGGGIAWSYLIRFGFHYTGLGHPVMWGVLIASFVFWVGIAHSGTLISAILYLFRARFRTAVYRSAEAMTVFAIMTAALFPIIHLGRAWLFFWVLPYPNQRELWPNFRSPLVWDVAAILTYFIVSALFLYTGLIPDLAALRDASTGRKRRCYALLALGWRGTDGAWRRYGRGYLFFAALASPLVISVHSVVSWDFAVSIVPGWHSTMFAPYFVAGAMFSGVAMVIVILAALRRTHRLEPFVTPWHFERLARLLLVTSLIVTYSYGAEHFMAFFGESAAERDLFVFRATGPYAPFFWTMILCDSVLPLLCFSARVRGSIAALVVIALLVNVGMYLERFLIVVVPLAHAYDPFAWGTYTPRLVEIAILAGSFGWFAFWLLLFVKLFPSVALAEMKAHVAEEAHAG